MSRSRGDQAEARAEAWLNERGLRTLARNHHVAGTELDLVMADGETVVFVEVRHREADDRASATESIGPGKRRRLIRAAEAWMAREDGDRDGRFDIVALDGPLEAAEIEWLRDAFDAD